MHIHAVNIGRPQIVLRGGRRYSTAIDRKTVDGPQELTPDGFVGDRVSDLSAHGGPDKAVCCYAREHYPYWRKRLGRDVAVPSFGENLTTIGLLEADVCIGDVYRIGTATVQVSQPRGPCAKLAGKHDEPRLIEWVYETGYTGFYLRVLEVGRIGAGDAVELIERRHADLSVARVMRLKRGEGLTEEMRRRLATLPDLAEAWRRAFAQRSVESESRKGEINSADAVRDSIGSE